jgi:PilZ domain
MSYGPNELEHRWGARVQVNIPIRVEARPLPMGSGWMKDLSLSGALIESDRDLRLHTLVEVSIALPPPSSRTAVLKAHVSRKFDEGVGIEWCEFAPSIIKDLVRSASRSSSIDLRSG